MKWPLAIITVAALAACSAARAATIEEIASPAGPLVNIIFSQLRSRLGYSFDHIITINGELEKGDAERFLAIDGNSSPVLVVLDSPGGLLVEGLAIGRAIHERQFATDVRKMCASACALAWLGGTPRIASLQAVILFHHASSPTRDEDAVANAILGSYLGALGFSGDAIAFMTEKGQSDSNLLTKGAARKLAIDTIFTEANSHPTTSSASPALVRGALMLVCHLDRKAPYTSGDFCSQATTESSTVVDVPPLYRRAWVPCYGNAFGAATDGNHGVKVDCGVGAVRSRC